MKIKTLSPEQLERYHRHLLLPEVGVEGQKRLLDARVLIVGVGGLGSPAALYLAAAGVGKIGLIDFDRVELSNLQRQILFTHEDIGRFKVDVAKKRLQALNPDVLFESYPERLTEKNAFEIFAEYDYILDGSDNFTTRYLVNDACILTKKINIYGSIFRFDGQASIFCHPEGPCYRCLYPTPPEEGIIPNCAEAGVLGVLPGLIGSVQACETIKLIIGAGTPLIGRLQRFNSLDMSWQTMTLKKNPDCPICGGKATITKLEQVNISCSIAPSIHHDIENLDPNAIKKLVSEMEEKNEPYLFLDVRTLLEHQIDHIEKDLFIPLNELEDRVGELDPHKEETTIIAYCRSGVRSLTAVDLLYKRGFKRLINMNGGIQRWNYASPLDDVDNFGYHS